MLFAASLLIGFAAAILVLPLLFLIGGGAAMTGTEPTAMIGLIGLFVIVAAGRRAGLYLGAG